MAYIAVCFTSLNSHHAMTTLQFNEEEARKLTVIYSTPDICAQREETLRHLALSPGEAVIDVGCGPGFLCESMAEAVGAGRVLGIDVSEDVLEFARRKNKRNWLTYRQGDAAGVFRLRSRAHWCGRSDWTGTGYFPKGF